MTSQRQKQLVERQRAQNGLKTSGVKHTGGRLSSMHGGYSTAKSEMNTEG